MKTFAVDYGIFYDKEDGWLAQGFTHIEAPDAETAKAICEADFGEVIEIEPVEDSPAQPRA